MTSIFLSLYIYALLKPDPHPFCFSVVTQGTLWPLCNNTTFYLATHSTRNKQTSIQEIRLLYRIKIPYLTSSMQSTLQWQKASVLKQSIVHCIFSSSRVLSSTLDLMFWSRVYLNSLSGSCHGAISYHEPLPTQWLEVSERVTEEQLV